MEELISLESQEAGAVPGAVLIAAQGRSVPDIEDPEDHEDPTDPEDYISPAGAD
jgi:hypothetical protein